MQAPAPPRPDQRQPSGGGFAIHEDAPSGPAAKPNPVSILKKSNPQNTSPTPFMVHEDPVPQQKQVSFTLKCFTGPTGYLDSL